MIKNQLENSPSDSAQTGFYDQSSMLRSSLYLDQLCDTKSKSVVWLLNLALNSRLPVGRFTKLCCRVVSLENVLSGFLDLTPGASIRYEVCCRVSQV